MTNHCEILSSDWKLCEIANRHALREAPFANFNLTELFEFEGHSVYVLLDPSWQIAAAFALDQDKSWVSELVFPRKLSDRAVLQILAKTFRQRNWRMRFQWKHGFIFSEDGNAYSVNALPDAVEVYGDLEIKDTNELCFPDMFCVRGEVVIQNCTIKSPPRYLWCVDLWVTGISAEQLAERICAFNFTIMMSSLQRICKICMVAKDLTISDTKHILQLPEVLTVVGNLTTERARIQIGGYQTIVSGSIAETHNGTEYRCLAQDFIGRLVGPGSRLQFLNLVERDKHGFPINIQNTQNRFGEFICKNDDGSYTCSIQNDGDLQLVDVQRMDVIAVDEDSLRVDTIP
jgi:hypothetical protein